MVKVFEGTEKEHYLDGYLKTNLDTAKKVIKKDWDMIFVVDGAEGSGKSVLTMQIAHYCDPTFNIDRVVFTPKDLREAIINSERYQSVVYDEAYTGLSSRATMSLINRTLISMLAEIRQKNLFVFVVMPCFFDLDKYVALWRSRVLVHVYVSKDFQRGFLAFYNVDKKKYLYMKGKKYYNYNDPKPNFIGRFTNFYVVDEIEYRKKKKDSLIAREKKQSEAAIKKELDDALFEKLMLIGDKISTNAKIELMSMPRSSFFVRQKQFNDMEDL